MIEKFLNKANDIIAKGGAEKLPGAAFQVTENMTIDECTIVLADSMEAKRWMRKIELYRSGTSDYHINHFRSGAADAIVMVETRRKALEARQASEARQAAKK